MNITNWVKLNRSLLVVLVIYCFSLPVNGQHKKKNINQEYWLAGCSPVEVGKLIAERYVASPFYNHMRPGPPKSIVYPEVCTWYGALTYAKLSGDKQLSKKLVDRFELLLSENSTLVPVPNHVDFTVFGAVPLEVYMITKDSKYLKLGKWFADSQWDLPDDLKSDVEARKYHSNGYTPQTRMWIDDMYMISAVQVQAYRATGELMYIERAAREMVLYLDSLQRPNGLFYHAPDVPFFWGRGNGWMAAGMTELLKSLPLNNPDRPRIMEGYTKMMESLLNFQAKNGTWRQLIDEDDSWSETSGTGMFAFAMITGVKKGWLDKAKYGPAARRAWLGLISYINENGEMQEVCEGTNKKSDKQYYLDRKRNVGDFHGQAPILWCVSAILEDY